MKKSIMLLSTVAALALVTGCGASADPLKVGMDLRFPPFETVDANNTPEGISVDIANAFGDFLNRETSIVNTGFGGLIPSLASDEIDIVIASMSITPARQQTVDFTNSYFYFKIITLVNDNFAELNEITEDSTTEQLLDIEGARYAGIVGSSVLLDLPRSLNKDITEFDNLALAIESVVQGTSDILLMSASPVVNGYKANRDKTMVVWDPWNSNPIGMAVKKGNTELLNLANEFIATFDDEDGLYSVLRAKYDASVTAQLERYGMDFYILP